MSEVTHRGRGSSRRGVNRRVLAGSAAPSPGRASVSDVIYSHFSVNTEKRLIHGFLRLVSVFVKARFHVVTHPSLTRPIPLNYFFFAAETQQQINSLEKLDSGFQRAGNNCQLKCSKHQRGKWEICRLSKYILPLFTIFYLFFSLALAVEPLHLLGSFHQLFVSFSTS